MKVRLNNGFQKGHKSLGGQGYKNKFKVGLWNKWLLQLNNRSIYEAPHVAQFRDMLEFKHPTRTHELTE